MFWILWSKKKNFVIIFRKENGNNFTLLIIFIVKSLQKEQKSTNLLLWPPICRNKSAITPKWFNSLDTNSNHNSLYLFNSTLWNCTTLVGKSEMKEKSRQKTYGGSSMAQAELSYASVEFSHGSRYTVDCDSGAAEPEGLEGGRGSASATPDFSWYRNRIISLKKWTFVLCAHPSDGTVTWLSTAESENGTTLYVESKYSFGVFENKMFVDITQQCFAFTPQVNFPANNLNFHWRCRDVTAGATGLWDCGRT